MKSRELGNRLTLLNCLLLAMGLFGTMYTYLRPYGYPCFWLLVAVAFTLAVLFYLLYSKLEGKPLKLTMLLIIAVWALAGLLLKDTLTRGADVAFRYIIPYLYKIMTYDFGEVFLPDAEGETACTVFIIYILVPYVAALVRALAFRKSSLISILLTALPCTASLLLAPLPPIPILILILVFWITLVFRSRMFRRSPQSELSVSIMTICACTVVLSTLFIAFPQHKYKQSQRAFAIRDDIIDLAVSISDMGIFDQFQGYISGAPLTASDGTVNLNSMGQLRFSDKDILRVYTKKPKTIYLRGYSASVYDGNKWTQSEQDALEQAGVDFQPMMYLSVDVGGIRDLPNLQFDTTVEMLRNKSNFVFAPYYLADIRAEGDQPQWVSDSHLVPTDQKKYSFSSYFHGYNNVITGAFTSDSDIYQPFITSSTMEYQGQEISFHFGPNPSLSLSGENGVDIMSVYDYFNSAQSEVDTLKTFYPQDSPDADYIKYIVQEYTKLPDGLREELLDWRKERMTQEYANYYEAMKANMTEEDIQYGLDPDIWYADAEKNIENYNHSKTPFWNWAYTAGNVADQIRTSGEYTTNPGFQPVNRDFVEYFLTESNKGYCVHFASATVAMLRALGIPARYAEGYVVTESMFNSNGWATVPSKNAHTWAEIWLPGVGWTPVESTPGGTAVSYLDREEDAQEGLNQDKATPTPQPTSTPRPTSKTTATPAPTKRPAAAGTGDGGGWLLPVIAAGILAVSAAAVFIARYAGKRRREQRFGDDDANRAAGYVYAYLDRLAKYGIQISEAATQLAAKAKFSQHTLNTAELGSLKAEFYKGREQLYAQADSRTKLLLWMQYI